MSHWHADGDFYLIRMRQFDKIFVRQTYRWKGQFLGFLTIYSLSRSSLGLRDISKKITPIQPKHPQVQQTAAETYRTTKTYRTTYALSWMRLTWPKIAFNANNSRYYYGRR